MADEEIRGGIFLPNFDEISDEWKAVLADQSAQWQAKVDRLSGLIEELLTEIRALRGVTVTIDRG